VERRAWRIVRQRLVAAGCVITEQPTDEAPPPRPRPEAARPVRWEEITLGRGEYPSARAAAIAAGVIKVLLPLEQIIRLLPKLTAEERATLTDLLDRNGQDGAAPTQEGAIPPRQTQGEITP
jgi:hypothetical protein